MNIVLSIFLGDPSCPGDIEVPVPAGLTFSMAEWTEPEGVTMQYKSHSHPFQFIQVGTSFDVRYDYEDGDGNAVECVFTVTGIQGKYVISNRYTTDHRDIQRVISFRDQNWTLFAHRPVFCYLAFRLSRLKNLKLFSILQ